MEEKVKNKTMTEGLFEKAKIEDSKAQAFLLTSIIKEVKWKIWNAKTSYEMMCKIKEYYDKERSKDISHYLRKLQSLKSKSIDESSEILRDYRNIWNTWW